MRYNLFFAKVISIIILSQFCYSQNDDRIVVGVQKFTSDFETKFTSSITETVAEMLTKSKRFHVVDRTSIEQVSDELKLQRTEDFIDSDRTTQQGVMVGADYVLTGNIRHINVTRIKNVDGSVGGYRASLSFTLKRLETSTGVTEESHDFASKGAKKALSPERAVDEAIRMLEPSLQEYFTISFPVIVDIVKILKTKGTSAKTVLISGGDLYGLKSGDKFIVQQVEMLANKPYYSEIGSIKIITVTDDNFSECSVISGGKDILARFNSAEILKCKLRQ